MRRFVENEVADWSVRAAAASAEWHPEEWAITRTVVPGSATAATISARSPASSATWPVVKDRVIGRHLVGVRTDGSLRGGAVASVDGSGS